MAVAAALGSPARAQVISEPAPPPFPDAKKFARGFFAQGDLGAAIFLGKAGRYEAPGVLFGARLGYDIFRWLAVQLHVAGVSSDANVPPPTVGQTIQTYVFDAEARFGLQIRRFQLFAEGGGGVALVSNNVLDLVGVTNGGRLTVAVIAGGGLDYHTLNRHFSFGLGADYIWLGNFNSAHALAINAYLRYTH